MYNQVHRVLYLGAIILLLSTSVFISCQSKQEKNTEETTEEMPSKDATSDWKLFKESAEKSIAANNEKIATINERIAKSNTPNLDKIRQKRIDDLKEQNAKLSTKIMEYKEDEVQSNFEQFKSEIQLELDSLQNRIDRL